MFHTKREARVWAAEVASTVDFGALSARIVDHIKPVLQPGMRVLTFLAMANEVDLNTLDHPHLCVTRTPPNGPLTVHSIDAPREQHRWGFEQPVAQAPIVHPRDLDLVLVPGAAFGRDGSRLGHGKGYYDTLLATCRADVATIGVTVDALLVDSLPTEPHDVGMDRIVTESGIVEVV